MLLNDCIAMLEELGIASFTSLNFHIDEVTRGMENNLGLHCLPVN